MKPIDVLLMSKPPAAPPLVSLDFKNGAYSINGVSKTLAQVIETSTIGTYTTADVVAGVGLRAQSSVGTVLLLPKLTAAAIAAAVPDKDLGFTAVMTCSVDVVSGAGTTALVSIEFGDSDPLTAGWGFQPNWQFPSGDNTCLFDYNVLFDDSMTMAEGANKTSFTLSVTRLAASIAGAAPVVTGAPQALSTGDVLWLWVEVISHSGGAATAIIERIDFYPPVADGALAALSA